MKVDSLIEINNLTKCFKNGEKQIHALKNINVSILDGEIVAIEGPSGSGKSTFLSLLGLLDSASSGNYFLRGQDVSKLTFRQQAMLRNQHIGWIFQNFSLVSNLTVIENVSMPLRYNSSIAPSKYMELASQALEKVGLADKCYAKPAQLSGGQQQRVAIARAIVCAPSFILADEPTGNLDSVTSKQIMDLLLEMSRSGATIIIVTHDEVIAKQCQRRIKILDGEIINDLK